MSSLTIIPGFKGRITINAPLAHLTTWRLGGPAEFLVEPDNEEDLLLACNFARKEGKQITVLGKGSNVLISDAGVQGLVLLYRRSSENLTICTDKSAVYAPAGVSLPILSTKAAHAGFCGFEFFCHIPGTIGGAVAGNAGTGGISGPSTQDVLSSVRVWDPASGVVKNISANALDFAYRRSRVVDDRLVILSAEFRATGHDSPHSIFKRHLSIITRRKAIQPWEQYTAGSVFKLASNHLEAPHSPGWYIDQVGLKEARVGGAYVSSLHANWIINDGNAKSVDVLKLMRKITETVLKRFNILLVPEVQLVGQHQTMLVYDH